MPTVQMSACSILLLLVVTAGRSSFAQTGGATLADLLAAEGKAALAAAALESGDARRGAIVFHTPHLTCTQCHIAGEGVSPLGPNLAAPRAGDAALAGDALATHLVESLLDPSAVIADAYRGATIVTTEGRSLSGLVARESPEAVVLRDAAAGGREVAIVRDDIDERVDLKISLMPAALPNLLADRGQFLDLVKYLHEISQGGAVRAAALRPEAGSVAAPGAAAIESDIDHAGFLNDWSDKRKSRAAFGRGEQIYGRVCVNCHGTLDAPGSLPTSLRFAEGRFKAGADPYAMYRTLTHGAGQMVAQGWMVPSQKYDVIHYIREAFLKDRNPTQYVPVTTDYLAGLPKGKSRGPAPSAVEPWRLHDYGPFLMGSIEVGGDGRNVARKGLAIRLDAGPGGIGRGHTWILYETDTLRAAAIWTGSDFIDWRGINFDGSHQTHPRVAGRVLAATPALPGWADPATGEFTDPRPHGRDGQPYGQLPQTHARFRALHHAEDRIVLDFSVGDTRILEAARVEPGTAADALVTRLWWIAPHDRPLRARVAAIGDGDGRTAAAIVGTAPAGAAALVAQDGFHVLELPARTEPLTIAVTLAGGTAEQLAARMGALAPADDLLAVIGRPARNPWNAVLETRVTRGSDTGPFATDILAPPVGNPWHAQLRFGGIDFLSADTAALCTWDGDVWTVSGMGGDDKLSWRRIASGLYQPLGLKVVAGTILVSCRDQIVALRDIDGDGCTDRYDSFNSDHQVTEHFHEFAMGLEADAEGNLYYAKSGRHGLAAVVPHHGTLLKVARDGSTTEILATGFRAANGVCVEPDGTFYVTDQEGFWNPKNRINHVRRGGFYGNMFGYHDVTDTSDDAMEPPLAWITNAFDRSPAEILRVPAGAWQPLAGELLELSYGEGRIHLVLAEDVSPAREGGSPRRQGGLVGLPMPDLPTGVMRGRFSATDGQLYACGLFAWAGNKTVPGGFYRIRRTAAPVRMPLQLAATSHGLRLVFSDPLDPLAAADPARWAYRSWGLVRSKQYGSKHIDERAHPIESVQVSADGRTVDLAIREFAPTWCYELTWNLEANDGAPVHGRIHGTVHTTP